MTDTTIAMQTRSTRTSCSYCGVGCGIVVQTTADGADGPDGSGAPVIAKVSGDKLHPTNFGRLCTKGATHAEMMRAEGRLSSALTRPARGQIAEAVEVDEAVAHAAERLTAVIAEHGPDAVALYVSGQMSIEAQYLANKLAKGFLRTLHIESNSRLCMASAGTGYKQSLGADGPPGSYADFDHADVFFVIGSNMADCHPILFLRMADRLKAGAKLIVVDPRRNATADRADLYLPIAPGTDLALLNGMLHLIVAAGHIDEEFIAEHTEGWEGMVDFLADYTPDRVAEITGLPEADIRTAARWIGEAGNWMSCWTMGLNQSTHGTWNTNAICNLHLATGAICRTGSGPMSLTGQPNAMGGREMGYMGPGLPGQRTVLTPADRTFVEERWSLAPGTIRDEVGPGTVEMFRRMADGDIKACWIICTNPVASMANRRTVIAGLEAAELVITQDTYRDTATNAYADVMLPATLWAEADMVYVNSERTLTLLPQSVEPVGDARPDWRLIADMATALGFGDAFDYRTSAEIFDEIRGFWNPQTGWDIRGADYERLRDTPLQWPCPPVDAPGGAEDRHPMRYLNDGISQTLHVDEAGRVPRLAFATPSRRAVFHPRPHLDAAELPDDDYPMVLNTGRLQHQWHTMTKTGKVDKLTKLNPRPFVEVHPDDAERLGIVEGAHVEIASRRGRAVLPAVVTDRVREGNCFAPFHWNDEHGEYLTINAVTSDAVDPFSLQPEFKVCAVTLRPVAPVAPVTGAASGQDAADGAGSDHPLAAALDLVPAAPSVPSRTEQLYLDGFLAGLLAAPVVGVPVLPTTAPIGEDLRVRFEGMLAGLYSRDESSSRSVAAPPEPAPARPSVLVVWASQTGNAETSAGEIADALAAAGTASRLVGMDDCDLDDLTAAGEVLVVTSTFGDGGPPDNAHAFWSKLSGDGAPQFTRTRFAVLGYGDSSYDDFCGFARKVDVRLAELGATRMHELVSVEPDDDASPSEWLARAIEQVMSPQASEPVGADVPHAPARTSGPADVRVLERERAPQVEPAPLFTRSNPIAGMLVRNELLTGPGSQKEVRRLGFDLLDAPVTYQAGDALGVFPANSPEAVDEFLGAAGLRPDDTVLIDDQPVAWAEALRTRYDITRIHTELLRFVSAQHPGGALTKLLRASTSVDLDKWLWGRHIVDLLQEYPVSADADQWAALLKRLTPRQYSISSSPLVTPREIQLTISVVRYESPEGRPRGGLCSAFLADHADDGLIPLYLQPAPKFRVPLNPAASMIMIGPGTGIAPFRGFLHERRAAGATGRNWLFFGDQHEQHNFYYRDELDRFKEEGLLTRLDLAFSRDQRQRIYVQDRMREHGAQLWRWVDGGASLYVCGDASRMAKDVDATLLDIFRSHGRMTPDEAIAYRKELTRQGRYQKDIY